MIHRTFDPTFLNTVVNHPEVRPHLQGEGPLDISAQALNPNNFVLQSEFGGFILMQQEPGRYEVHSQFLPGHGTHPVKAMLAAMDWMFTRTDCEAVVSKVPVSNKAAKGFAITGGLRTLFTRTDTVTGPIEYTELTLMDWAMRTKAMESHGERFHAFLDAETCARGVMWPEHPKDTVHDMAAGAALLMIERGQPGKGVLFYNRWAMLAGYTPIRLLSDSPVTIDMSDGPATAILGMGIDGMEMLLCR